MSMNCFQLLKRDSVTAIVSKALDYSQFFSEVIPQQLSPAAVSNPYFKELSLQFAATTGRHMYFVLRTAKTLLKLAIKNQGKV